MHICATIYPHVCCFLTTVLLCANCTIFVHFEIDGTQLHLNYYRRALQHTFRNMSMAAVIYCTSTARAA